MPIYPYSFTLPPVNKQDIPSDGVAGEFLGISAGGVLDWLPVSGGSGSGDLLAANNLSELTATAGTARTNLGLGTTDTPTFKNLVISTGSIATSAPVTISQTWDDVAQTFTALKVDAAGSSASNSANGSLLADFQVNGVSKFSVRKDGSPTPGTQFIGYRLTGYTNYAVAQLAGYTAICHPANGVAFFADNLYSSGAAMFLANTSGVSIGSGQSYSFKASTYADSGASDTFLLRDGAPNTLALRNGGAPQAFNVYGTSGTNNTDYRRLGLYCPTTGEATIQSQFSTPLTVTGGSAPSTTATISFTAQASAFPVGSTVVVSGVTPSGYNGTYVVTASTTTSVSYTVPGALAAWSSGGTAVVSGFTGTVSINGVPVGRGRLNYAANVAIGISALSSNTLTNLGENVSIGDYALANATQTYWSTAIGYRALAGLNNFSNSNVAVGFSAGEQITSGFNFQCSSSVFIGYNTKALGNNQNNQIVIGANAVGLGENSVVLGNSSITTTALRGNVGIGTTAPRTKLHLEDLSANPSFELSGTTTANFTGVGFLPNVGSNTTGRISQASYANGGISIIGFTANTNVVAAVSITGYLGATSPTQPAIGFYSYKHNGTTGRSDLASTEISAQWGNGSSPLITLLGGGNVGIGTTAPSSKLHVESASPTVLIKNSSASGFGTLSFSNTIAVSGNDIWQNGSAQAGYGGPSSLNIQASSGPLAFHTGTVTNAISLAQNGTCTHAGNLIFAPDNSYDIGASGANRPRNVYVGGFVQAAGSVLVDSIFGNRGASIFSGGVDGNMRLTNNAGTDFGRFQLGGTTDSFPAIARDGAGIKFTGAAAGLTSHIKVPAVAVGSLPAAATAGVGARAFVNDALAPVFGNTVATGGAVAVPVYSDGSAWKVG